MRQDLITLRQPLLADTAAPLPLESGWEKYLGFCRANLWWYVPVVGDARQPCAHHFQFLLLSNENQQYLVALPANQPGQRLHLCITSAGVAIANEWGQPNTSTDAVVYLAYGENPAECFKLAFEGLRQTGLPATKPAAFWSTLGWCSWEAFRKEVDQPNIEAALASLTALGHTPGYIIIDDGWQQTQNHHLAQLEADPVDFPSGLLEAINHWKTRYNVKVGAWHPLFGGWAGVTPELATSNAWHTEGCSTLLWAGDETPTLSNIPTGESIDRFINALHSELAHCGVDFVKIDGQAFTERVCAQALDTPALAHHYQQTLSQSVNTHFSGQSIHCMSHEASIISSAQATLWRNSDDYLPHHPDSHGKHIYINALNNLWSSQLGIPDWDMFMSATDHGEFHAMGRILSGGPVYISDPPGKHNAAILNKLTANGSLLLKPDAIAKPSRRSIFSDATQSNEPLRVYNHHQNIGIVGIFNCRVDGSTVHADVHTGDIEDFLAQDCLVYDYQLHHANVLSSTDRWWTSLHPLQCNLLTFSPFAHGIAVIGIVGKYLPCCAITNQAWQSSRLVITLKCGGEFWFACQSEQPHVFVNGQNVTPKQINAHGLFAVDTSPSSKGNIIIEIGLKLDSAAIALYTAVNSFSHLKANE